MRNIILLACLLILSAPARAAETASFLNLGVGARYLAMGGAGTALSDDANALYWNAAGLADAKREFTLSDMELQQSTRLDYAAVAVPTSYGTFAGGGAYLSQGAIDGRDATGRATGSFNAADADVALAYGRKTDLVNFGATVKFVQSHIASAQATTVTVDFGARKQLGNLVLAAALRNIGPGMKFDSETDDLPLRLALSGAYKFERGALTAELTDAPRAGGADFGFGGEYQAIKNVYLRAGYTTQTAITGGSNFDAARGLTLGVGFHAGERWTIDYAAVPMGELGSTHRFTLGARW